MAEKRLIAFDMDGTMTQHKTALEEAPKVCLDALGKKYKLLMIGAGAVMRIFNQLNQYPIDIAGNYGMQLGLYKNGTQNIIFSANEPCDREAVDLRVTELRNKFGYTEFTGDNVEFHPSGCITIPLLGTKANPVDKLAFDPDRKKRRIMLDDVKKLFPEYNVFIGGSSSFDMNPVPYDKAWALDDYCRRFGYAKDEVIYVGDDYNKGGNDEPVLLAGYDFIKIDNYLDFPKKMEFLL